MILNLDEIIRIFLTTFHIIILRKVVFIMKEHYDCIYMYINKIDNKKYVGQAKNFNKRHYSHLNSSYNKNRKDYDVPIHKAIRKYGIENFEIKILAENIQTQEKMNEYEIFFIKRYQTLAIQGGYNISEGGYNNPFAGKTEKEKEEIKRKISKSRIDNEVAKGENNPMYGKHHTKEMKEKITNNKERSKKISKSLKGHSVSDESREKISKNHADVSGSNHPRARKIAQYNLNEELIKIWNCISQAEKELGISHISNCCNGKRKTAGGFKWKYVKED